MIPLSQDNLTYQVPSASIADLVNAPLAPGLMLDEDERYLILMYRDRYKSIAALSETELRLAGLRINPATNIGNRTRYYNSIKYCDLTKGKEAIAITGLPDHPRLTNFSWSPDQKKMAFTHTTADGVELWLLDLPQGHATKLTEATLNANLGDVLNWSKDNQSIFVKLLPEDRKPLINTETAVPTGPTVTVSDGKKAQNRTYQDLLKDKNDEFNFEQLARSEIWRVWLDGRRELWKAADMYSSLSLSPNGEYIIVQTIKHPFSYLVPYFRFSNSIEVYTTAGEAVKTIIDLPLLEDLPQGFMATRQGKRSIQWRSDAEATLVYAEAQDKGDPAIEVAFRDYIYEWEAPFTAAPKLLTRTINRYSGIMWGNDKYAILHDNWWNTRNLKTYLINPSTQNGKVGEILFDRNYQDEYSDPGSFETKRNHNGRYVLALNGSVAYMLGQGFSEKGQFPFLNAFNLDTKETTTLYRSTYTDKLEQLFSFDPQQNKLLESIESPTEYPNIYFRDMETQALNQITDFPNPYAALNGIHKEVIIYNRKDGLELSGTLYLPTEKPTEPLPLIIWAYPQEYKDKDSARQSTQNSNEFTHPFWGSPIYWVTKGYAILDDASFPIVGEGKDEPNDTFIEQLVSNAAAAIDFLAEKKIVDRQRVAVGGHSYGAFMVANLLSHSDLFAAGIARSGAYNRTLTPFGFQSEERYLWDAPAVYYALSPFLHADKMKTPLLLVHGEADSNSGTYPMQSERYFNALKGLGAPVRLVMLPKESHSYSAHESILHLLWEQDQWLETYVKNKK